tara:strand:- start:111857 stop:112963 length:1107 start_codon:yes stop_codon:yes gene_type:complete
MEFFDRKEEVIEIKLTQFGKRKLADGFFKPKYYAFYDDDVMYDASYGGTTELPHLAGPRIQDAVRMKLQSAHYGIESDIDKKIDGIRRTNGNIRPENLQQIKEKSYTLINPLGNSNTNTDFAPSWEVKGYFNQFTNIAQSIQSGSFHTMRIPQLDLEDVSYEIVALEEPDLSAQMFGHVFDDGTSLSVDTTTGEVLLSVRENNSPLSNEKFDMEFYMVNEENGEENLLQLNTKKDPVVIVDDILLDIPIESKERVDETYVEKYFIIQTDEEIPRAVLLSAAGENSKFAEQGELRGLGNSYSLQSAFQQDVNGLIGSRALASMSPDELARLSDNELTEAEQKDAEFDKDNPYGSVPENTPEENCEYEEQ